MKITVRSAQSTDLETIIEFNRLLAWESEGKQLDPTRLGPGVASALEDPAKARYFVADFAGEMVGQLGITTEWSDWRNGWFWWIQSVYVHADHRRRGVFRSLYRHVERTAQEVGDVIGIRLYVEHDNEVAQATYLGLGMLWTGYRVMEQSFV